jgi:two-component system NtrC family response regulator
METNSEGSRRNVLVVDDDEGMRMLMRVTFEFDARYEVVDVVGSRAEVVDLLDGQTPPLDVALVDVTLPDADGVELITELRDRFPGATLALYTGWSDPELTERATAAGADQVFSKALDPQEVLEQLAQSRRAPAP